MTTFSDTDNNTAEVNELLAQAKQTIARLEVLTRKINRQPGPQADMPALLRQGFDAGNLQVRLSRKQLMAELALALMKDQRRNI